MYVVFSFNLYNSAVYNLKHLTTKDTFRVVSLYADHFDDKNLKSFTTWCSRKKKKKTTYFKHVMKQEFLGNV